MGVRRYYEYVAVGEEIYVTLLNQHVEEENKRLEARSKKRNGPEEIKKDYPSDSNGDGVVSDREHEMYLEFKRKELDDQDAQRDAMRKMTWYALAGLLLYPFLILVTSIFMLKMHRKTLPILHQHTLLLLQELSGSAFFGADAIKNKKSKKKDMDF